MNDEDKLIEEQFQTLPPDLQRAINAVPWKSLVQEVGKANALDVEQITSLEQETMLILYAFEKPDDFIANITREIGIDDEKAGSIAVDIADKILVVIQKKSEEIESQPVPKPIKVFDIPPANLPVVEPPFAQDTIMVKPSSAQGFGGAKEREVAHEAKHIEQTTDNPPQTIEKSKPSVPVPDYRYPDGKDPYREPLK